LAATAAALLAVVLLAAVELVDADEDETAEVAIISAFFNDEL
jgi:hypothetical protein